MATPNPAPQRERPRATGIDAEAGYWSRSRKPLQILVFLVPLILFYELGLALVLRSEEGVLTNKAHETLLRFFATFGVSPAGSLYLGGAVIVVVLMIWHLLNRDPWRVSLKVAGIMALEALVLTLPLLVLARLISRGVLVLPPPSPAAPAAAATTAASAALPAAAPPLSDLDLWSRMAISVGAGIYEELMFRMLLIAVIHTLLVDVGKASHLVGATFAVVASAVAFTVYHPLTDAGGQLVAANALFYFLAGLYFGAVYAGRGFGIVVAVHALYDIIIVCLPGS